MKGVLNVVILVSVIHVWVGIIWKMESVYRVILNVRYVLIMINVWYVKKIKFIIEILNVNVLKVIMKVVQIFLF